MAEIYISGRKFGKTTMLIKEYERRIKMAEKVNNSAIFREKLVQLVKDAGQEIIDNADDYVGKTEMLSKMSIVLTFDPSSSMLNPTIEVEKEYLCKRAIKRLRGDYE